MLTLGNDRPEWAMLQEEGLACFGALAPALAAKQSYVQVACPAGGNLQLTVENVLITNDNAAVQTVRFGITTPSSRANAISVTRDSRRNPGLAQSNVNGAITTFGSDLVADGIGGSALNQPFGDLPVSGQFNLNIPFVVGPGDAFTVWGNSVNQSVLASLFWRERAREPTEIK